MPLLCCPSDEFEGRRADPAHPLEKLPYLREVLANHAADALEQGLEEANHALPALADAAGQRGQALPEFLASLEEGLPLCREPLPDATEARAEVVPPLANPGDGSADGVPDAGAYAGEEFTDALEHRLPVLACLLDGAGDVRSWLSVYNFIPGTLA